MADPREGTRRLPPPRRIRGAWIAAALGFLVVPGIGQLPLGGPALAVVLVSLGGFVSVLVRPGWWGFLGNLAGLTAFTTLAAASGSFAGPQFLILAILIPPVAVGAAGATIVNLIRAEGVSHALTNRRAWAALGLAIVLVVGWVWLYTGLVASNAPA